MKVESKTFSYEIFWQQNFIPKHYAPGKHKYIFKYLYILYFSMSLFLKFHILKMKENYHSTIVYFRHITFF